MRLDAMQRYRTEEEVDAVVIGTGAGGAPCLQRLARAGLRVVALEAGRNWTPGEDFATDEVAAEELAWSGERVSAGETPEIFGAHQGGMGVGGSTLRWTGCVPRADARDLRIRTEFGVGADWPLEYEELLPYYEEVERFLAVSGPEVYPWDPGRRYPLPAIALNAPAQAMRRGCEALGLRTSEAPIAVVSRDYEMPGYRLRQACVNRGYCEQGCRNGAKASMDVTYLPVAVDAGAEIRPESFVHGFERDATDRITAVIYRRSDGVDVRQRCRAVFLCAGAVETPRLLLHTGLANSSGQVGRNLLANVATEVWGTFPHEMRMNKGFPSSLVSEDMVRAKDVNFAGGYLLESLGALPVTWSAQVARSRGLWGQALVDSLDEYNFVAGLRMNGDCLPDEKNSVTLAEEVDAMARGTGMRRALVSFSYGKHEGRMSAHAEGVMLEIWKAAGARDPWVFPQSAHAAGTCRMGPDSQANVVDRAGRSFDIPNLWICDQSVFPSALAANPGLTVMALSLRTADAFLASALG